MKRGGHFPALEALDAPTSDLTANLGAGDRTELPSAGSRAWSR
jgi:hypothetical protein